jgi:hypothetical protein
MVVLPDPPPDLPEAPWAFYEELRAVVADLAPPAIDEAAVEVDFGRGLAVTLPHRDEPDWTLAAQVSPRAAVVFAGPVTRHFTAADGPAWTSAAVALLAAALRGELEVEVAYRGDELVRVDDEPVWGPASLAVWKPVRTERVRVDFGARSG